VVPRRPQPHHGGGGQRLARPALADWAEDPVRSEIERDIDQRVGTVGAARQAHAEATNHEQRRAHDRSLSLGFRASFTLPDQADGAHGQQDRHARDRRDVPLAADHRPAGADQIAPAGDIGVEEAGEDQRVAREMT
jgi:hypothetical protein